MRGNQIIQVGIVSNLIMLFIGINIIGLISIVDFQSIHPIFDELTGIILTLAGLVGLASVMILND